MEAQRLRQRRTRVRIVNVVPIPAAYYWNEEIVRDYSLGQMESECTHCGALHFQEEMTGRDTDSFSNCCQKGKIQMDRLPEYPEFLKMSFNWKPCTFKTTGLK